MNMFELSSLLCEKWLHISIKRCCLATSRRDSGKQIAFWATLRGPIILHFHVNRCYSVMMPSTAVLKCQKDYTDCKKQMLMKNKIKKKIPFCVLAKRETSNSRGIINCIKLRWIIITQYQVVSRLLQSNKSAIRLRFVSRSRNKQTNKHKSVVFLAASYCSQCPTGPNGPKVGQIYYIERLLFND